VKCCAPRGGWFHRSLSHLCDALGLQEPRAEEGEGEQEHALGASRVAAGHVVVRDHLQRVGQRRGQERGRPRRYLSTSTLPLYEATTDTHASALA